MRKNQYSLTAKKAYDKFLSNIANRLMVNNQNYLCILSGSTGSGKSMGAISFSRDICKFTKGTYYITFKPLEFMQLLNDPKLKKGDVIICDEFHIGMNSRDYYTVQNKLLSAVLSTFRNLNVAVIFTTPSKSFIDINARRLFHQYINFTGAIDREHKVAYAVVYNVKNNDVADMIYYPHPLVEVDNKKIKLKYLGFLLPPEEEIESYLAIRQKFTDDLNKETLESIRQLTEGDQEASVSDGDIVKSIIKNKDKYVKEYGGKKVIKRGLVENDFKIGGRRSARIKDIISDKLTHTGI